ncbi:MAG: energy transducer TonB, partial [Candidatus Acidiferrales bacterium]
AEHIVHRVNPELAGPRFASVPVRFVINKQGKAEHIHAIAGFPEQIKGVLDALPQWTFKPYEINGQTVEVETGLLFEFRNGQN